jgi:flavin reductase (DIM6/NTAB) family NADH-FMN oxidoreductase RutF
MKVEVPIGRATRLINPGTVVLVTARHKDRVNAMPAAWAVPLSKSPPLVGVALQRERYTYDLIKRSQEFALCLPGRPLAEAVVQLGSVSGHEDPDKLHKSGLTLTDAQKVSVPVIEECLGWIECGLADALDVGDHVLVVGEVLAAKAEEEAFDEAWLLEGEELKPLHHLGGSLFAVLEARIAVP